MILILLWLYCLTARVVRQGWLPQSRDKRIFISQVGSERSRSRGLYFVFTLRSFAQCFRWSLSAFRSFSRWRWSVYKAFHLDTMSAEFQEARARAVRTMKPHRHPATENLFPSLVNLIPRQAQSGSKPFMVPSAAKARKQNQGNQRAA